MVEYSILQYEYCPNEKTLNALAQEGWRVVAVTGGVMMTDVGTPVIVGSVVLERERAR